MDCSSVEIVDVVEWKRKNRNQEGSTRPQLRQKISTDALPTRLHSLESVKVWHVRRVILDSSSYDEAAERLGITKKTLWEMRRRHHLDEQPAGR